MHVFTPRGVSVQLFYHDSMIINAYQYCCAHACCTTHTNTQQQTREKQQRRVLRELRIAITGVPPSQELALQNGALAATT
eukprot:21459-Heterococcus_DN1.PRE.5